MTRVLSDYDVHLLAEGTHLRAYERMGAHLATRDGVPGVEFVVWAPNARGVSVVGDFNGWDPDAHPLHVRPGAGTWEGFIPGIEDGARYKFSVLPAGHGEVRNEKADPFAFFAELRPHTASIVHDLDRYEWHDHAWMQARDAGSPHDRPMSVYEVHLGSWARVPEDGNRWLTYREAATRLTQYVKHMGYTHVELMPVAEHALDESWGYQTMSYYAPTSRFGTPEDFMYLVDSLHAEGIGVIVDWVPAHFPRDAHGLGMFDGTHLYEHADPRMGEQPDWGTYVFNYGRREVANFLIANALFWFDRYHVDGIRVDAVAAMLYRDYSRGAGAWIPNEFGGRENLEAVHFLRRLNEAIYEQWPGAMTVAEESTSWPMVSRPTSMGGLGFGFKWNMGWMHDTLRFFERDAIHRGYHLGEITFGLLYAFTENFVLPFSHDEVVHLKGSMLEKMPGDRWQQFANLRALYGFMYAHPGKKLLFQGSDFAQVSEWNALSSLDWHLLNEPSHQGMQRWVRDLNAAYRVHPALWRRDFEGAGFEWLSASDAQNVVLAFVRRGDPSDGMVVAVINLTPVPREGYRLGVPASGTWVVALNSDAVTYGGSGYPVQEELRTEPEALHGCEQSITLTLPPLSVLWLTPQEGGASEATT